MGMFDYINFVYECPTCGNLIQDFQTKDGLCSLNIIDFYDADNFYSSCDICHTWIEFKLKRNKIPIEAYDINIIKYEDRS